MMHVQRAEERMTAASSRTLLARPRADLSRWVDFPDEAARGAWARGAACSGRADTQPSDNIITIDDCPRANPSTNALNTRRLW